MIIDTLLTIGAWSAASVAGIYSAAFGVKWYKFNQSAWSKSTGDSFLQYCYKKYLQPNEARRKGYSGEVDLSRQLEKVAGKKRLLFNVLIPDGPEKTTEVDALMIHETGIYVFENKNYSGKIGCYTKDANNRLFLGNVNPDHPNWTIEYGPKTRKSMYNPLMQNEKHLFCVKRLLSSHKIGSQHFFSYITFNESAKVKGAPFSFQFSFEGRMLKAKHLAGELNSKIPQRCSILSEKAINEIADVLDPYAHVSKKRRDKHIQRVAEIAQKTACSESVENPSVQNFPPLQNVIVSAESKENSSSIKEQTPAKNYMNLLQR